MIWTPGGARPLDPPLRMTDACENITFPPQWLRTVTMLSKLMGSGCLIHLSWTVIEEKNYTYCYHNPRRQCRSNPNNFGWFF